MAEREMKAFVGPTPESVVKAAPGRTSEYPNGNPGRLVYPFADKNHPVASREAKWTPEPTPLGKLRYPDLGSSPLPQADISPPTLPVTLSGASPEPQPEPQPEKKKGKK